MKEPYRINPYKSEGLWMFDDDSVGLHREVLFTDQLIERATAKFKEPEKGFCLTFGSEPFEGYQYKLNWKKAERGGNVYHCPELDAEGWLCPALFKYFDEAPKHIYATANGAR